MHSGVVTISDVSVSSVHCRKRNFVTSNDVIICNGNGVLKTFSHNVPCAFRGIMVSGSHTFTEPSLQRLEHSGMTEYFHAVIAIKL